MNFKRLFCVEKWKVKVIDRQQLKQCFCYWCMAFFFHLSITRQLTINFIDWTSEKNEVLDSIYQMKNLISTQQTKNASTFYWDRRLTLNLGQSFFLFVGKKTKFVQVLLIVKIDKINWINLFFISSKTNKKFIISAFSYYFFLIFLFKCITRMILIIIRTRKKKKNRI